MVDNFFLLVAEEAVIGGSVAAVVARCLSVFCDDFEQEESESENAYGTRGKKEIGRYT